MIVHGFVDSKHIKKEKAKARVLRKSQWWKQKLSQGLCHYCGKAFTGDSLTMDHKVPLSRGGTTSRGNVVPSCKACNSEKKFYTPAEMLIKSQ
jgi:5-methylcytosine-specific restriction enzyme A